ncbi:MAG: sodium:solute symporter [Myxococcota bacterium]
MTGLDWAVMLGTIAIIVVYGVWSSSRGSSTAASYLKGEDLRWPTIGLSIMATQASAITFLSVPGQAYDDGMGFVQFYFGLPIAMVIISAVFVPIYYRLEVYTAYEYLEQRFDVKVRVLAALLFMVGRGLAAGISIYAPAIVLSSILGWSLNAMNVAIGATVIVYTVTGGAKAVSQTQRQQMVVIMAGILIAAAVIAWRLPTGVSVGDAATLAGALGRMEIIDFSFDPESRYTIWSGLTGGLFLALSYFGTDQSQVQRYLGGRSMAESRLGLLFNGLLKIPMQFLILFIGILVFAFHLFERPPIFFNQPTLDDVRQTEYAVELSTLEADWDEAFEARRSAAEAMVAADTQANRQALVEAQSRMEGLRTDAKAVIATALPRAETEDHDYIFIAFVLAHLPAGLVGLLLAVILSAAMSSTASELNALGATSVVDLYRRLFDAEASDRRTVALSKGFTVVWGLVAIAFATFASLVDNLIEAVNIIGSLFYGVSLGLFLVGFFLRRVTANPTFVAGLLAQAAVLVLYFTTEIGFLWFNLIGCVLVVLLAQLGQLAVGTPRPSGES